MENSETAPFNDKRCDENAPKPKNERIIGLDILRGLLMFVVFYDHFLFDAGFIFNNAFTTAFGKWLSKIAILYVGTTFRTVFNTIVHILFFSLSGVVTSFSKSKIKRPLKYLVVCLTIFLATLLITKITGVNCLITFGVMYCYTICAFIAVLLDKLKVNKWAVLGIGLAFTLIGALYQLEVIAFLAKPLYFIFPYYSPVFLTADYFPIFPYAGYFLIGMFLGKLLYKERKPLIKFPNAIKKSTGWIAYIGRTSLWWYLLSQVFFYAFYYVVTILGVM